jgi:hypothetical protein
MVTGQYPLFDAPSLYGSLEMRSIALHKPGTVPQALANFCTR